MDEFPPNSHTSKEAAQPKREKQSEEVPEKKVEKIVQGTVIQRKKPLGKRMKEMFISGDSQTVGQYIMAEVVVPATKDLLADAATSFVERILFGDGHQSRRGGRYRSRSGGDNYTRYTQASRGNRRPPWEDSRKPREISRRARQTHDFKEIILETRAECEEVIEQMFNLLEKYEVTTVADLYDLIGADSSYTDDKWGWYDLRDWRIQRIRDGYLLNIPRPEPLN